MSSIFTNIVKGEIPCYKIAEDEHFLAFLDINPLRKGHALVIPKKEVDYIFDIDDELYTGLMLFAKKVSVAIKSQVSCNRIGVVVIGLEVAHAHIHLIPIDRMDDMNFTNPKLKLNQQEFVELAENIAESYNSLSG